MFYCDRYIELWAGEFTGCPVGTGRVFPSLFILLVVEDRRPHSDGGVCWANREEKYCAQAELWHINASITQTALRYWSWGRMKRARTVAQRLPGKKTELSDQTSCEPELFGHEINVKKLDCIQTDDSYCGVYYTCLIRMHECDTCQKQFKPGAYFFTYRHWMYLLSGGASCSADMISTYRTGERSIFSSLSCHYHNVMSLS